MATARIEEDRSWNLLTYAESTMLGMRLTGLHFAL
jgi:hypothetical protein